MKKSSLARCWVVGYPTIPLSGNIGRSAIFSHSNPWSLVPFSLLPIIGRVLEISRHISCRHIRPLFGTFHKILKTKESEPVPRCSWPDKALHQLTSWSACFSQQTTLPGKKILKETTLPQRKNIQLLWVFPCVVLWNLCRCCRRRGTEFCLRSGQSGWEWFKACRMNLQSKRDLLWHRDSPLWRAVCWCVSGVIW